MAGGTPANPATMAGKYEKGPSSRLKSFTPVRDQLRALLHVLPVVVREPADYVLGAGRKRILTGAINDLGFARPVFV